MKIDYNLKKFPIPAVESDLTTIGFKGIRAAAG